MTTTTISYTVDRLTDAARIWAAACSTAGAMAPDHIADALAERWERYLLAGRPAEWELLLAGHWQIDGDAAVPDALSAAVTIGTHRASEERASYAYLRRDGSLETYHEPRGCCLDVQGGRTTAIVWDTGGSHVIRLRPVGAERRRAWCVEIDVPAARIETSPRVAAMLAAAWSWRDGDEEHARIREIATGLGRDEAWLEARGAEQTERIAHRRAPSPVTPGDTVTMAVDYDDGEGPHVYRGTVRRIAPGGRRVLVDWTGEDRPRRSWYVDAEDLQVA